MSALRKIATEFRDFLNATVSFPASVDEERKRLLSEQRAHELKLAEVQAGASSPAKLHESAQPDLIIWKGTLRELAAWIVQLYEKQLIEAGSSRQAIIKSAPHFSLVPKNGDKPEPIDGISCYQSFQNPR